MVLNMVLKVKREKKERIKSNLKTVKATDKVLDKVMVMFHNEVFVENKKENKIMKKSNDKMIAAYNFGSFLKCRGGNKSAVKLVCKIINKHTEHV